MCSVFNKKPLLAWPPSCLCYIYCSIIVSSQCTCCVPVQAIFRGLLSHCGVHVDSGIMARMQQCAQTDGTFSVCRAGGPGLLNSGAFSVLEARRAAGMMRYP